MSSSGPHSHDYSNETRPHPESEHPESDGDSDGKLYKSGNNLASADQRAKSSSKHKHGDAVIVKIDGVETYVWVENPELDKVTNKYQYQLVDEDGGILAGGKFFGESALRKDVKRRARK